MLNPPPPQSKPLSFIQKLSSLFLTALFLLGSATHASAAVLKLNADNQLIGVEGLEVTYGPTENPITNTYNLDFVFGTFTDVFGTPSNPIRPFTFTSQNESIAVANEFLRSVFIDSPLGNFDSDLSKTQGCISTTNCILYAAYFFGKNTSGDDIVLGTSFNNRSGSTADAVLTFGVTSSAYRGFAVASPVAAVPEASTYAMMGLGLVMLAGVARRRKTLA